jgi:hypothetical protein
VQGCPTLLRGVRIGAVLEQLRGHLVMRVGRREHERAGAVEQGLVRIGTGGEQRARRLERAGTHGEQQRGEVPGGRSCVTLGARPQ